jgi:hypothetical protein
MFYEDEQRMYTGYNGGHRGEGGYLWFAFIIFIIFAIISFIFLRNDNKHNGLADTLGTVAALKASEYTGGGAISHTHDLKDYMHAISVEKDFGEIKKEIVVQTLGQSREMDNKFHEVMKQQALDTASLRADLDRKFFELSKEQWASENARLRDALLLKEISHPKPMFAYEAPAPFSSHYGRG